ncbi:ArgE/DapE family deacylase (plasmid) [Roseomonas gilardii subsp. gilardii]|uniref:ArgE/DapE family deacylase n=1 Tax=Roseomonas gilardii TaxID=257708 RepID=UPI001FFB91C2|nr:ArgE/DapE family deacylase [Roseomonas gilardii]UPG74620.1 ArgE/DapE family deacylase [Roseomonas gilardii subsp. gilardii]
MMSHQESIRAFLDREQGAQAEFLAELVRMPSDNPPGDCRPHAERTAGLLRALGHEVELHAVPEALVRAHGMISVTNLVVRRRFGSGEGPVIALNAHGDVVPPGEGWTRDPYGAEVVDGWMYGRGVAVSKSDFATYAWALRALEASGAPLSGTVELHLTYDEEAGGEVGPGFLLSEGITKPDLVLSAGFSYNVVTAHNGCLHLEVEVNGRSAHAAMPFTGVDALEAATAILSALYEWRKGLAAKTSAIAGIGSPQLTVGLIKGGINTNVVPDRVTLRLDRRMIPEENPAEAEAELRRVIADAAAAFPKARAEVRRILLAEPLKPLPGGDRLVEALCRHASQVMGEPITAKGVPLYTDARLYAAHGIPAALYGAGPRTIEDANAHRADERLPLSDLRKATEVVALTLADLLAA